MFQYFREVLYSRIVLSHFMRHRYVYAIQEEGTNSMQLDATRMYILCRPWMAHDGNCTRAHATSVTARRRVGSFAPASFRLAAFSSSRFKRSCPGYGGENATSIGYRGATLKCGWATLQSPFFSPFLWPTWLVVAMVGTRKDAEKEDSRRSREKVRGPPQSTGGGCSW